MNVGLTDPKACEATREWSENAIAALKNAQEQGKHFVIEWRHPPDTKPPRWQGESDAGCGCGLLD